MIHAAMRRHAGPGLVLNVLGESAVLAHVSSRHMAQPAEEVPVEIATSRNTAVANPQSALPMSTIKMGEVATETRLTVSPETVKPTMTSASITSTAVSIYTYLGNCL